MKKYRFLIFVAIALTMICFSCNNSKKHTEMCHNLWQRHIEKKEVQLKVFRKNAYLEQDIKNALMLIDSIKSMVRNESENLSDTKIAAQIIVDYTISNPLNQSLRSLDFAQTEIARVKYSSFEEEWQRNYFVRRTAAETLLYLIDLQIEIITLGNVVK